MIYSKRAAISTRLVAVVVLALILIVGVGYYVLMPPSGTTSTTSHTSTSQSSSSTSSTSSTSSSSSTPTSSSSSSTSSTSTTSSSSVLAVTCSPQPVSGATQVTIEDFAFSPKNVTISAGQSVTWTYSSGSFHHTVTSDTGLFSSPSLFPGGTYTCTFTQAGTYGYHCAVHPAMKDNFVIVNP